MTDLDSFLTEHPAWEVSDGRLRATFEFADFNEAMGFVQRVALVAERQFHHPRITVEWNTVEVSVVSHDAGGLTDKDVKLAEAVAALA